MLAAIQNLTQYAMIDDDPTATKTYLSNVDSYRTGRENADWFMERYNGDMTLVNQFHTQLQVTSGSQTRS